ncbi:hypothetical protein BDW71DRAFT_201896 [Aspergillus fruticulosus]
MVARSQLVRHNNKRSQSDDDASSDVSEVFSDFESDSDSNTDLELDNEVSDSDDNDPDDDSHNDEGQLSPEHYLAQAESLNEKLDDTHAYWNRYCQYIGIDPALQWKSISDSDETVCFLYGFFAWRCDIHCGKNGQHSLETASGLCKETIYKVEDVITLKNIYIEDVTEFAHVLLTTIEMTFACSWNEFKILEIIFNLSLVLSPHVCLLSMLFHIQVFKRLSKTGPVLDSLEKLYSLWDELSDKFVFCQVECKPTRYQIVLEKKLTAAMLGSRLHQGGEITGFDQVTHPYNLQYTGAKAFNNSSKVTDALQNVILQYTDIHTFVQHYEVDVDVDVQGIVCKIESQTPLSLNKLPVVLARQEKVNKCKQKWEDCKAKLQHTNWTMEVKRRYNITICELSGKLVNTKYLVVIDALLTMLGTTLEAECQRWIDAINALTAFCPMEEGQPIPRTNQSCRWPVPDDDDETGTPVKQQQQVLEDDTKIALRQVMEFVTERTVKHTTPGSLTRHFLQKHINPPWPARGVECNVCGIVSLAQKANLLNHAELCHGTVVRGRTQREISQACKQATLVL